MPQPGVPPPWRPPVEGAWRPLPLSADPITTERRPPRALFVAVAAFVFGFTVFVLAGGVALTIFLTRDRGPHYPKQWDPRVADIVAFDEATRGLTYKHPVEIEFLSDDAFAAVVTKSESDLSDEDKAQIDQYSASYRALGLIDGDVDLFQEMNDLSGGGTLAYYDPKQKKIRVRGTEMTPALRVTLAHEMTHVLQDQYFDLNRLVKIKSEGERTALRAVTEGDARGIERAYALQLSDADRQSYADESGKDTENAGFDKAPQVLVASFTSPYVIGPPFVAALRQKGGNAAVNEAIRTPPASEAALLDIFDYLAATVPTTVDTPMLEPGQKRVDDGEFGATVWYLMLARRLDVHDAVKAVDGWGGDSFLTSEDSAGRICVTARYRGKTYADSDAMKGLLDQWESQSPPGSGHVRQDGAVVEMLSCDPGTGAHPPGTDQSMLALELLATRLQVVEQGFKEGASGPSLDCISTGLISRLSLADLDKSADADATVAKVRDSMAAAVAAYR